jgi:hypothetical protein
MQAGENKTRFPAGINASKLEATGKSRQETERSEETERSGEALLERARLEQAVSQI